MADAQRETENDKSVLNSYLSERFASDDQILSRLPGLVSQIVSEPEASEDEKSIEQWCKAIVSFRTAEIKARVDTIYLTNVAQQTQAGSAGETETELRERKAALQAELEELHSEIASVTEMVVEHEIRKPMADVKERRDRDGRQARTAWLNYVRANRLRGWRMLTGIGLVDARVHGQTTGHGGYKHAGLRRVSAGTWTRPSSGGEAYA